MIEDPLYGYRGKVRKFLEEHGVKIGDRVRIERKDFGVEGILMPRAALSEKQFIVIKLDNGYNIGVRFTSDTKLIKVAEGEELKKYTPSIKVKYNPKLPKVSIISTGGTIASRVDYRTGAVYPALKTEDILEFAPEIMSIANIEAEVLFSIFSENMTPELWSRIAEEVAKKIWEGFDGVVVPHGTDTMSYTAAALAFALRNLPVPVVLVGSQRSSDRPSSDAAMNLYSAVLVAGKAPFAEVTVVMHGETADTYCLVHRGTKVRKMHTSRRDAFRSINDKPLAKVVGDRLVIINNNFTPRDKSRELALENKFDGKVALVKTYPGMSGDIIDFLVDKGYHGIVLEGTGLGHAPVYIFESLKRAIEEEIPVVMTSQCLWGRINMNVYSTGRDLLAMGVIPGEDMLPEVALVKLMWVLAKTRNMDEVRKLMLTNIAGEINPRTVFSAYLS